MKPWITALPLTALLWCCPSGDALAIVAGGAGNVQGTPSAAPGAQMAPAAPLMRRPAAPIPAARDQEVEEARPARLRVRPETQATHPVRPRADRQATPAKLH